MTGMTGITRDGWDDEGWQEMTRITGDDWDDWDD